MSRGFSTVRKKIETFKRVLKLNHSPEVVVLDVPAGGVLAQVGNVRTLGSSGYLNSPVNLEMKNNL